MKQALKALTNIGAPFGTAPLCIGILPTLSEGDLSLEAMTDKPRYKTLAKELLTRRGEPFRVFISGDDPIDLTSDSICLEGANTSLQLHLRVPPAQFSGDFQCSTTCDTFDACPFGKQSNTNGTYSLA